MPKPTHASVTDVPCQCHYLERLAADPLSPIIFDPRMNEFQFEFVDPMENGDPSSLAHLYIYHCPFCGGAAPESKRGESFAVVTEEETTRIIELCQGIKTLDEVLAKFGQPANDNPRGLVEHPKGADGRSTDSTVFRTLTYDNLSLTAEVVFAQSAANNFRLMLGGKYLGPPKMPGPMDRT